MFDLHSSIKNSKIEGLSRILSSYKVDYDDITVELGLSVDVYSVRLSLGTRVGRLERILPEIGMRLRSHSDPIGLVNSSDGVYSISVQTNQILSRDLESFKVDLLKDSDLLCPVVLGVDKSGSSMISDLSKMPNLLIGGVPGSGKSMLLHSIIASCIANGSDLYLCDPKLVEFSLYKGNSSVRSISYGVDDFRVECSKLIRVMNDRYLKISSKGCSNFSEYNEVRGGFFTRGGVMKPSVLIIDEWADIYLEDKSVEKLVCTIAQKGRAAGIFVILATQRPSSNILSGLIKGSFPARIALKTSTAVDSRVVLESSGAEKMTDPGTGLYRDSYTFHPKLFRSPLVCRESVLDFIGN